MRFRPLRWSWLAALWLWPVLACAQHLPTPTGAPAPRTATVRVTSLDVGQGDATLIEVGEGDARRVVLIDGGPTTGADALLTALRRAKVRAVDLLVMTHPHLDHIGGLWRLLAELPVRAVLDSGVAHPTATFRRLLEKLVVLKEAGRLRYQVARRGQRLDLGHGARLEVLAPAEPLISGSRSDVNANSVVLRLVHGKTRFLFPGDAEVETEARLLGSGDELGADVLKVAHHGSRHATGAAFLARVSPRFALISCGRGNDYGHPTRATLARLSAAGITVLRTDEGGSRVLLSDGETVRVATEVAGEPGAARAPPAVVGPSAADAPRVIAPRPTPPGRENERSQAAFVASRRGRVFHHPECATAVRIASRNRVEYPTRAEAEDDGRTAHRCLKESP